MIKKAILHTDDGERYDLLLPGCKNKFGLGGRVEVQLEGEGQARVSVNGIDISDRKFRFPEDLKTPQANVTIEHVAGGTVAETKTATVEIFGIPANPPPPKPKEPAAPQLPQVDTKAKA